MQEVDLRISDVSELEKKLVEAMQQYHDLMSRAPAPQAPTYGAYLPQKPIPPAYGTPPPMATAYQVGCLNALLSRAFFAIMLHP
ncbi:unnamed protein product [Dibothriocephalus latus]|uniref:Uncharacterized protein n=1 Tax=Dibothriocephalus latus TaxID=60516 RepID=A0A3P7MWJ9_DIBLA|nr:unnamed protein product [Dibothriocephalus latus]